MRILVVSAHFPPNFVSGGTLVPQRLARGLRTRGHDVSVYAGRLDDTRRPLDAWDDADETGLAVRWIVTTPWTGWGDRHNFDNPGVVDDFAAHAAATRPDIVHLHSLQTLGAGLLPAAKQCGARVVVTMHDFWWFCARQFLVTRDHAPCSLVVDCGECECEVDRPWLDERNRLLAGHLRSADLILAPSASAAAVFAANGVPEGKLRVNENGMPEADRAIPPRPRRPEGAVTVRFRYTGGWNRMKGAHVLLDAARRLGQHPGWRLTAHDIEPFIAETGAAIDDLPVDVAPPFPPHETDAVFAQTDVLLVPSVMRESHSIVTREALSRGVPVICTDTLGPEEVVEHGRNGLIVPAGDSSALAEAMRSVVDDAALLGRLRAGTGRLPMRSLAEQVVSLEESYRRLLADQTDAPDVTAPRRTIRRVLFIVGITGAPLRYRARLPAEALGLLGVETHVRYYRHPDVEALASGVDALVVYRVPATVQVLDLITRTRAAGVPVLFDVDDLIFDPDLAAEIPALSILPPNEAALWLEGVRRYRTTMEACDAFVASTPELRRHAERVTGLPAYPFENGVGLVLARLSDRASQRPRTPGPPRIAYFSGTDTHDHDWAYIENAVAKVLSVTDAELWLVGLVKPSEALAPFGARVRRLPFKPWVELPALLRDVDVNLAPLAPGSRFNEAKSAIKWLEAALVGTPTVASPTEPFRDAIESGVNGILASTGDDWLAAIDSLLVPGAGARIGSRARRDALLRLSPHLQGRRYLHILETIDTRRAGVSDWVPVVHDEPLVESPLDPYEAVGLEQAARRVPVGVRLGYRRMRGAAAMVWRAWRREGTAAVARKAAGRLRSAGSAIRRDG